MKIIKQGRKIPKALYKGTCSQCGCDTEITMYYKLMRVMDRYGY